MENSSNSSTIVPAEIGNTETSFQSPPTEKKKQPAPKATWLITINVKSWNSSNSSKLKLWISTHCSTAIWQIERGDSGNLHIQLTMTLRKKNRLTWLKNHFCKMAHCETVNNHEAAYNYTQKNDTREEGPYYYPEQICTDEIDDIIKTQGPLPWQKEILDMIKEKPHPRKIFWFYERKGAVGKTELARHIILNNPDALYVSGAKKDIIHAWKGQRILIFNFSRTNEGCVSYDAMESLKDGIVFSGKYDSCMKVYNRPHVICFANWKPDTSAISKDKWVVKELNDSDAPEGASS